MCVWRSVGRAAGLHVQRSLSSLRHCAIGTLRHTAFDTGTRGPSTVRGPCIPLSTLYFQPAGHFRSGDPIGEIGSICPGAFAANRGGPTSFKWSLKTKGKASKASIKVQLPFKPRDGGCTLHFRLSVLRSALRCARSVLRCVDAWGPIPSLHSITTPSPTAHDTQPGRIGSAVHCAVTRMQRIMHAKNNVTQEAPQGQRKAQTSTVRRAQGRGAVEETLAGRSMCTRRLGRRLISRSSDAANPCVQQRDQAKKSESSR